MNGDSILSVKDFANAIRQRTGAYQNVPDQKLTEAFLNKYPQYRSVVNLAGTSPGDIPKGLTPQRVTGPGITALETAQAPAQNIWQNVKSIIPAATLPLRLPAEAITAAAGGPQALQEFATRRGGQAMEVLNPATALQALNPMNMIDVQRFREQGIPQGVAGTLGNVASAYALGKALQGLGGTPSPYRLSPKARTNKLSYALGASTSGVDLPEALRGAQSALDVGMSRLPGSFQTTKGVVTAADKALAATGSEFNLALQQVAGQQVMPTSIEQGILRRMSPYLLNSPEGVKTMNILQRALPRFQQPWSYAELDFERTRADARLSAFHAMERTGQATTMKLRADAMIDKAISDGTKDAIYNRLDQVTGKPPGYFEALKQQQSHLIDIRTAAERHGERLSNITAEEAGGPRWSKENIELRAHGRGTLGMGGIAGTLKKGIFGPVDYEARASKAIRKAYATKRIPPGARRAVVPYAVGTAAVSAAQSRQSDRDKKQGQAPSVRRSPTSFPKPTTSSGSSPLQGRKILTEQDFRDQQALGLPSMLPPGSKVVLRPKPDEEEPR